jgi:methylmalonyl-CoA/ethylmalonyl-CoA epimerase
MFKGLDHLAIAVADTEEALKIWRDRFRFPVLYSERVNGDTVLLTHLDLGNTHLQLVQPLVRPHPLWDWLEKNGGSGLHHFCLKVDDVAEAGTHLTEYALEPAPALHQGTQGKRALFIQKATTDGVQVELTGK